MGSRDKEVLEFRVGGWLIAEGLGWEGGWLGNRDLVANGAKPLTFGVRESRTANSKRATSHDATLVTSIASAAEPGPGTPTAGMPTVR